jgi:3-hydroxybutyryl-CoA dehydrogenase
MRIILVADKERKEELVPADSDINTTMTWTDDIHSPEINEEADACIDILFDGTIKRVALLRKLRSQLFIVNAVITPATELPNDFVRINGWNSFLKSRVIEAAEASVTLKQKTEMVFAAINKNVEWVPDIQGFLTPRVVASIINEAYFALQENVSSKEEIDIAMKSGTNYPFGPFEWSRVIGLHNIHQLLQALSAEEKRYEPANLLTKEATS